MNINLRDLRRAMENLNNLPETVIVQQHPDASSLSEFIKNKTDEAKMIIQEVIDLLEEKATLQSLIDRREEN